jgi:hypothetical protein
MAARHPRAFDFQSGKQLLMVSLRGDVAAAAASGRVTQVIGPVVDVAFPPGKLPALLNALTVSNPNISDEADNLVLEVG